MADWHNLLDIQPMVGYIAVVHIAAWAITSQAWSNARLIACITNDPTRNRRPPQPSAPASRLILVRFLELK